MSKNFSVKILNPDRVVFDDKITSLVVPCENGYLGVLADHAPLVANVVAGTVKIRKDEETKTFTIQDKGFLEVLHNEATIFLNGDTSVAKGKV